MNVGETKKVQIAQEGEWTMYIQYDVNHYFHRVFGDDRAPRWAMTYNEVTYTGEMFVMEQKKDGEVFRTNRSRITQSRKEVLARWNRISGGTELPRLKRNFTRKYFQ